MRRNIVAGIDVGTHETKVVLVEYAKNGTPAIVGTGKSFTEGMHMGYVIDSDLIRMSIQKALAQAEKIANFKVKRARLSCGGVSMSGEITAGYSIISRADKEITDLDVKNVIEQSEENLNLQNKKIVYTSPIGYKIDGKEVYGDPIGMKGAKLDSKIIFVTVNKKHLDELVSSGTEAGLLVLGVYPNILAESKILLSQKQKMVGCALVNIGEDTTTLAVFENSTLISLQVYPIGGKDIRGDIALYFKISLEEAEGVKTGTVLGDYPTKQVANIIEARLGDIFESIENHLKKLKRSGLLPAGVIISGGGAHIQNIEQVAKNYLNLPVQIGPSDKTIVQKLKVRDETWYTALGLAISENSLRSKNDRYNTTTPNIKNDLGGFKKIFKSLFSQLLP